MFSDRPLPELKLRHNYFETQRMKSETPMPGLPKRGKHKIVLPNVQHRSQSTEPAGALPRPPLTPYPAALLEHALGPRTSARRPVLRVCSSVLCSRLGGMLWFHLDEPNPADRLPRSLGPARA